jgi:hypothetical protein
MPRDGGATQLLRASTEGNRGAEEQLIPLVYDGLSPETVKGNWRFERIWFGREVQSL